MTASTISKPGFGEISSQQLMRLIGTPASPTILDVCLPEDVADSPFRIPTSISASHRDLEHLVVQLKGKSVIVVCQKGKKLSHGVAASLRSADIKAEVLFGGMTAWQNNNLPSIPIAHLPKSNTWVTRHRPKIDRVACPWLITRFIDPNARFLYVPPTEVMDVADRFNATPFDHADADLSHDGTDCTFDALLRHFKLDHLPLQAMAQVIRAADTNTLPLAPQAEGLLALSIGLSRMYKDDHAQLAAAIPLYDALYRWARDGQSETHDSTLTLGA